MSEKTFVIFGSGPSVTEHQINYVKKNAQKCKIIAINAMYKKIPFADYLYFCDYKFYKWHAIDSKDPDFIFHNGKKYTICPSHYNLPIDIVRLKQGEAHGLSRKQGTLCHGSNSGYQCINLAYLKGAQRIILIGLDMTHINGKTHCHAPHQIPTPLQVYDNILKENYFETIAEELDKEGIEVINCSSISKIKAFKKAPLETIKF